MQHSSTKSCYSKQAGHYDSIILIHIIRSIGFTRGLHLWWPLLLCRAIANEFHTQG